MGFKGGNVLGTIALNTSTAGTTSIGSGTNTGTINIGNTSSAAVAIDCGTAGITVGTTANVHTSTFGSTNSTSNTIVQAGSNGISINAVNGGIGLTSGTGGISIGADATSKNITIGSVTGTTSVVIDSGTGGVNVGTSATAHTTALGSTNSTSQTVVQSGTGGITITATNSALTMISGTGTLSIANDATAQTVNLATGAGAKLVTLGTTNGASSLALKTGTADFSLASATGTIMAALDTGEVTFPLQPAFSASLSSTQSNKTGTGTNFTVICNTEQFDVNSDYDNTTGTLTSPVTGKWMLTWVCYVTGCTIATTMQTRINTSNNTYQYFNFRTALSIDFALEGSVVADMDAADTCTFTVLTQGEAGDTDDILGSGLVTMVSGFLLG